MTYRIFYVTILKTLRRRKYMFCKYCGAQINDQAEICPNCGCRVKNPLDDKPLKGVGLGFILAFFLNVVGLIIACILGDESCKKTAIKTFIICACVGIVLSIFYFCVGLGLISSFVTTCL